MQLLIDLVRALRGLNLLFRFNASYLGYFDKTIQATWRSFFAMLLVAVAIPLTLPDDISKVFPEATWAEFLGVNILIYILSWTLYPQFAHEICRRTSRLEALPGFITIYNWFQLIHLPFSMLYWVYLQTPSFELYILYTVISYAVYFIYLLFICRTYFRLAILPASVFLIADYVMGEALTSVARLILWH